MRMAVAMSLKRLKQYVQSAEAMAYSSCAGTNSEADAEDDGKSRPNKFWRSKMLDMMFVLFPSVTSFTNRLVQYELTTGNPGFLEHAAQKLFGDHCSVREEGRVSQPRTTSSSSWPSSTLY